MNSKSTALRNKFRTTALGIFALVACCSPFIVGTVRNPNFWRTADQRGDALLRQGRFAQAARTYNDPLRQGVAWYRSGEFDRAARAFARVPDAAGAFNQGNALLMRGAYDKAIASYDRALELRPGWVQAEENRALAVARRERVKKQGGDITGGQTEPDEIVFDLNKKSGGQKTEAGDNAPMSDAELSALWLRRVQTTPGDFLRAKFAYQVARSEQQGAKQKREVTP